MHMSLGFVSHMCVSLGSVLHMHINLISRRMSGHTATEVPVHQKV